MHTPGVFLTLPRQKTVYRPVEERVRDFQDVARPRGDADTQAQSSRCVECGTPFCHWRCPLGNQIPDWNDALANGQWAAAYEWLRRTNNFPEITGRLCPAPCEASCILALGHEAVTIRENELAIIEHAFQHGLVQPRPPAGIHFAMDYLAQSNRVVAGETIPPAERIDARDKHVVVIGGSDTGADCVGTAVRQGARRVTALGFVAAEPTGLLQTLGVPRTPQGTIVTDAECRTPVPKLFAAGDACRGQSLVVHALCDGRRAAHFIDRFLTGRSSLPLP